MLTAQELTDDPFIRSELKNRVLQIALKVIGLFCRNVNVKSIC